jgi:biotin-(acetyl-CoA carboxylase) ligase
LIFSQEEVTVDMDGDPEQAIIQGLDEHGYLEVRSKKNGTISHVTDNGNSFDMMKGLIRAKFS